MTTWTLVSDTSFSAAGGAVPPPAAGGTLFDGWVDSTGTWSINGAGQLVPGYTGSLATNAAGALVRPLSEAAMENRIVVRFTHQSGALPILLARYGKGASFAGAET